MSTLVWKKGKDQSKQHFPGAIAYYVYRENGQKGRQRWKTTKAKNPHIAEQIKVQWDEAFLTGGSLNAKKTWYWEEFFPEFLKSYSTGRAPSTIAKMVYVSDWMKKVLKIERLRDVTPKDFDTLKNEMLKELEPETINSYLSYIGQIFATAHAWNYIPTNPAFGLKRIPTLYKEPRWLENREKELVLSAASNYVPAECAWNTPNPEIRSLAILMAQDMGLRAGEIVHQKMEDVLLDEGFVKVAFHLDTCKCRWCQKQTVAGWHPKGRRERYVPITPRLREALETIGRKQSSGLLVPFYKETVLCWVKAAYKKVKIGGKVGVHTLRHSFATEMERAGISKRIIRLILGHANPSVTDHYTHSTKDEIKAEFQKLLAYRALQAQQMAAASFEVF